MRYHVDFDIDFRRNSFEGTYIAVEGVDGSGKTTQVERLTKYFKDRGREVVRTREPRKEDGMIAELVQKILHGKTKIPAVAFQYLFSADREMHHEELVIPSLKAGKVVISDRCFWSSIPYGLLDRGIGLEGKNVKYMLAAQCILSMYHQFIVPDYSVYLDVPLNVAMKRIEREGQKKEIYEEKEKLEKIIKGYKWLVKEYEDEFVEVDATKSVASVTKSIVAKIKG